VSIRTRGSFRGLLLILTLFDDVDVVVVVVVDDDDDNDEVVVVVVAGVDVAAEERSSLDTISVAYLPLFLFTSSLSSRFKYLRIFRYRSTKPAMAAKSFSPSLFRLPASPSSVSRLVLSVSIPNSALDT